MKNKKTPAANLENKRFIFFQIGIILSLALALTAFEWRSYEAIKINMHHYGGSYISEYLPPPTKMPKKPKPKPPVAVLVINPIPDDSGIEPDDIDFDAGIDESTEIKECFPELPDENIDEEEIFIRVEVDPQFPGGSSAMFRYLSRNIKYPMMAIETGIQGVVYVMFVVEKDGSITDISILRGLAGGCDEEAMRVVKMMPRWKPGKQFNKTVRVQYTLPVRFILQN